jgi:uncharacterized iron-regulated membrane protein
MEMLMLCVTGTLCLLTAEIVDVIRARLAQPAALGAHPLATSPSQVSTTPGTLKRAA